MSWKEERLQTENNICFMLKVVSMKRNNKFKSKKLSSILRSLGSDHQLGVWD